MVWFVIVYLVVVLIFVFPRILLRLTTRPNIFVSNQKSFDLVARTAMGLARPVHLAASTTAMGLARPIHMAAITTAMGLARPIHMAASA